MPEDPTEAGQAPFPSQPEVQAAEYGPEDVAGTAPESAARTNQDATVEAQTGRPQVGDVLTFRDGSGRDQLGQVIAVHPDPDNPAVQLARLDTDGRYVNPAAEDDDDDPGYRRLPDPQED